MSTVDYISFHFLCKSFLLFFKVYSFLRDIERQRVNGGRAEREGDTESEAGSRSWAVGTEPDAGLELTSCEIMAWAEVRRSTDSATQAPPLQEFLNIVTIILSVQLYIICFTSIFQLFAIIIVKGHVVFQTAYAWFTTHFLVIVVISDAVRNFFLRVLFCIFNEEQTHRIWESKS